MVEGVVPRRSRSFRALLRSSRWWPRKSTPVQLPPIKQKKEEKCDSAIHIFDITPQTLPAPIDIDTSSEVTSSTCSKELKRLTDELPTTQRAFVVASEGKYEICEDHPTPQHIGDSEVVVKPHTVGLNPIDWKSVSYNFCLPSFPWITGRELSGTVVKVGRSVTNVSIGDRVWTSTYYKDARAGFFQEFVTIPDHTAMKVPSGLDMDEASCLGVAGLTAAMTLWRWLGVSAPKNGRRKDVGNEWLLIWGGSTVTGQFATQLAAASGLKVITVTSSQTQDLSRSMGAAHIVSRDGKTDQDIVGEIEAITEGNITRAIDLVGPKTASLVLQAVSKTSRVDFAPLSMISPSQDVPENVLVHTVEMKQFVLDASYRTFGEQLNELVAKGSIIFPDLNIIDGGLDKIEAGLELLKLGNMGGRKLVVRY